MTGGMSTKTCLERSEDGTPEGEARTVHAWTTTGLDEVNGALCSTRRCVWCARYQHKTYGGRGSWRWTS